jgi:hypothetical protein
MELSFLVSTGMIIGGLLSSLSGTLLVPLLIRWLDKSQSAAKTERSARTRATRRTDYSPANQECSSLAILLPAPEGEEFSEGPLPEEFRASLESITSAIAVAKRKNPSFSAEVFIGTREQFSHDAATVTGVLSGARARIVKTGHSDHWEIVRVLVERAWAYDWLAVVEPGTVWSPRLLSEVVEQVQEDGRVALVSPRHGSTRSSSLMASLSAFASAGLTMCKNILLRPSRLSGLPIALNPATTFYRSDELIDTFRFLQSHSAQRGNLLLPFVLKAIHPQVRIVGTNSSRSAGVFAPANLQSTLRGERRQLPAAVDCLRLLKSLPIRRSPALTLAALEYLFISGWVYWTLAMVGGSLLLVGQSSGMDAVMMASGAIGIITISLTLWGRISLRTIADEISTSLRVPLAIAFPTSGRR